LTSAVPTARGRGQLLRFVAKVCVVGAGALGAVAAVVGLAGGKISPWVLAVVLLAVFGALGWLAAVYVACSPSTTQVSIVERLIVATSDAVAYIPFVDTTLRATLLNQRAIDTYWQRDDHLRLTEIACESTITGADVENVTTFRGSNDTRVPAATCPMLLHGGRVTPFHEFPVHRAELVTDPERPKEIDVRSVLDLGQVHFLEMVFPTPLARGERFEIRHRHAWPDTMVAGYDIMWYPFVAMFRKDVDRLTIVLQFDVEVASIQAYEANLREATCAVSARQFSAVDQARHRYEWTIDDPDRNVIYFAVFRRPAT
jgi:hypothetical protein